MDDKELEKTLAYWNARLDREAKEDAEMIASMGPVSRPFTDFRTTKTTTPDQKFCACGKEINPLIVRKNPKAKLCYDCYRNSL